MLSENNIHNKINEHIGAKILKYRTNKNMTQAQLAEKTDTTSKFVSQLENGKTGIKIDTLIKYINVLDISPNELFDGLFNNSFSLDISLENKISELNNDQKNLLLEFIEIIINYDKNKYGK